jgi:hypothetical protein
MDWREEMALIKGANRKLGAVLHHPPDYDDVLNAAHYASMGNYRSMTEKTYEYMNAPTWKGEQEKLEGYISEKFLKRFEPNWARMSSDEKVYALRAVAIDDLPGSGSILTTMASMAAPHLLGLAEKYAPMLIDKVSDWAGTKISNWWSGGSKKPTIQPSEATSLKNAN